jgi:enamine deaminase RidA (YjgF/YER057c/UK114 family)
VTAPVIRRELRKGAGYSVADLDDVRYVLAGVVPQRGGTLREQADEALSTIAAIVDEAGMRDLIAAQTVFLADGCVDQCRQICRDFYGSDLPATTYVPQPPCDGRLLAIEVLGVGPSRAGVTVDRVSEQLALVRHSGIVWAHGSQVVPRPGIGSVYGQAIDGLQQLRSLFGSVHIGFEQVARTWFYLGGILDDEEDKRPYHELNQARADFYRSLSFFGSQLPREHSAAAYPASTAIGSAGRGIILSAIALATERSDLVIVPLENPQQTPAYDYKAASDLQRPKFSRALALSYGGCAMLLISGTASIRGSQARHAHDAVAQTNETLDNIVALISEENLCRYGLDRLGTSLKGLALARVYVKREADYAATRAVCEKRLGKLPVVYAVADICRPELLVEIEGIAFSRRASQSSPETGRSSHRQ